ncbi:Thioredoxin family protein [Histomonas meleagridis]|uniref:Thioredoxin family protein n=1 Tax=Histomonas meleagridis TaxID=135588 RepID=UPI00355AB424|nr:Thioredoxin family protein [Histomonas meleagridis]KAH0799113.1 Thioredoxin family protein [Histomonas meleagridis]
MHPAWHDFMKKYAEDEGILVAEINALQEAKIVDKIHKIRGYPTYLYIEDGRTTEIYPKRTLEGFSEKADELKTKYKEKSCNKLEGIPKRFPAFVLTIGANSSYTCHTLGDLIKYSNLTSDNFYLNSTHKGNDSFGVFVNKEKYVRNKSANLAEIKEFISDFKNSPLGNWHLSDVKFSSRRVALLVYSNTQTLFDFKHLAESNSDSFIIGKTTLNMANLHLRSMKLVKTQLPALLILDKNQTKCAVYENVQANNEINELLTKAKNDELEMKVDFEGEKEGKGAKEKVIFGIAVCSLMITIIAICAILIEPVPKIE